MNHHFIYFLIKIKSCTFVQNHTCANSESSAVNETSNNSDVQTCINTNSHEAKKTKMKSSKRKHSIQEKRAPNFDFKSKRISKKEYFFLLILNIYIKFQKSFKNNSTLSKFFINIFFWYFY